jgi:hypothetical protein
MFSPVLDSKKDVRLDRSSLFVLQQSNDNVVVGALQQPVYEGRVGQTNKSGDEQCISGGGMSETDSAVKPKSLHLAFERNNRPLLRRLERTHKRLQLLLENLLRRRE